MTLTQKIAAVLLAVVFVISAHAQKKPGSWQDYLSFTNATKAVAASSRVYCVTEGGLFYYDLQDNSINKFSALEGLSDFGIKTIAYSEINNLLVVAYENSNIDLVFESGVINLSDIKRKQLTGSKAINNITVAGDEAYLSCGFGIVVLNLTKQEIKDTYFIGEGGTALQVNDVEIFGDFIYAATTNGVLKADKNNDNLLDYNNWQRVANIPFSTREYSHLMIHSGSLVANYAAGEYSQDKMYRLSGDEWKSYLPEIRYVADAQQNEDYLVITTRNRVYLIDNQHQIVGIINSYEIGELEINEISPRSATVTGDGSIWIADYQNGLIRYAGNSFESIFPNGPKDNKIFGLTTHNGDLWVVPGGRSDSWNNVWEVPRFQLYRDGKWNYFTEQEYPVLGTKFWDIVDIEVDPKNPDHIFVGSWGGGILEFKNGQFLNQYTNLNSPLQTALPSNPESPYTRIGGLDFDSEGNLWITNSTVARNLLKLAPDGEWEAFVLPEVANSRNIGEVLVTRQDDKWILVPRGHDAYVVDKTGGQKHRLLVTSYFNNGQNEIFNRMNDVYSIAEDNEGAIWIGTSKGVAVYNNPQRIWTSDNFYAIQPSLDLGDGLYHPLLETETVTAIAVDGANRKWLGTRNSGVYLVSQTGEEEILHFTKENSPLLSNSITAIGINQLSGEVFIGTEKGLISYQGNAIAGKDAYADVYVYPNPVRENYDGPVTITGLIEQTDIKITDISGNLVYTTTSLGGQAVWDGKNLNGNRVKTGVYLVFCNDELGEETHIAKLLFIN